MKVDIRGKNVFLSGPVSGMDRGEAADAFQAAYSRCVDAGARFVFNPVANVDPRESHEHAMLQCLNELTTVGGLGHYDLLVQLHGWRNSEGALMELAVADACGIPAAGIDAI